MSAPSIHGRRRLFVLRLSLTVAAGMLLGFSFPPSTVGALALVGLVPLLIVLADIDRVWAGLRWVYVAMAVFHVITLNWTGGYEHGRDPYMMIAGGMTMLIHPLFYFLPMGAYLFVKRHAGPWTALLGLPFLWTGYEFSHTLTEWSFPWLTLAHSQSYNLAGMQFISITGILGITFWILLVNASVFVLYSSIAGGRLAPRSRRGMLALAGILLLVAIPSVHGWFVLTSPEASPAAPLRRPVTVGMIQPDFDPWEKWAVDGPGTIRTYLRMTDSLLASGCRADLVLWPETAIPFFVLSAESVPARDLQESVDSLGVAILTGLPHRTVYRDSSVAPKSAKRDRRTGQRYDTFNAAALIEPFGGPARWHGKMKMVPLAERIPYAEFFSGLDFLRWEVGMGGWAIGKDTVVFREERSGSRFGTQICYESTYPDFVADYVRRGAEFLTIITIDSWWGHMSGAFQHHRIAVFRAVENRRWIARCAVGGISCYIDPYGRTYDDTGLFSRAVLCRTIGRDSELTAYTRAGNVLGEACLWVSCLLVAAAAGERTLRKHRTRLWSMP